MIAQILDAARFAPSGANTQPWQVAVVAGETKLRLQAELEDAFRSGEKPQMDYHCYAQKWFEPYQGRRIACGKQLYDSLNIRRQDGQRRIDQWVANYRGFDAPVIMLFFLDRGLEVGSYIDYGIFLQSLMLAALEQGLATCAQASLGGYPERVKRFLGYPLDSVLIGGMAIGYADEQAAVNCYRTPRQPVTSFTKFFYE
jgi:nitroreductase